MLGWAQEEGGGSAQHWLWRARAEREKHSELRCVSDCMRIAPPHCPTIPSCALCAPSPPTHCSSAFPPLRLPMTAIRLPPCLSHLHQATSSANQICCRRALTRAYERCHATSSCRARTKEGGRTTVLCCGNRELRRRSQCRVESNSADRQRMLNALRLHLACCSFDDRLLSRLPILAPCVPSTCAAAWFKQRALPRMCCIGVSRCHSSLHLLPHG